MNSETNNECKTFLDLNDSKEYKQYLDLTNSKEYIELYNYYQKATFMDVLGVSRQENPHSSFWGWLLSDSSNHEMGDFPLRKFIETVCFAYVKLYDSIPEKDVAWFKNKKNLFNKGNKKVLSHIKKKNYTIKMVNIYREMTLNKQRRADIVAEVILKIENKEYNLYILIENKVGSSEHDSQTPKYANDMYNKYINEDQQNKLFMFCYLSSKTNEELKEFQQDENGQLKKLCESKEFVCINYQYLVDGVLEPSILQVKDANAKYLLKDYLRCLGKAILDINPDNKNATNNGNYLVMAVSQKEKTLVNNLWKTHKDILTKKLEEIADPNGPKTRPEIEFYCSIVSTLLMSSLFKEENKASENLFISVKEAINDSNKKFIFSYKGEKYQSNQRGEHTLGFLAHLLIKEYLQEPAHNLPDAINKLKDAGIRNSSWLHEIIIQEDKVNSLRSDPGFDHKTDKSFETNSKDSFGHYFYNYPLDKNGRKMVNDDKDYYKIDAYDENGKKIKVYTSRFFGGSDIDKLIKAFEIDTVTKIQ